MQINKQEEGIKRNENGVTVSWSDEAQWKLDNFYLVSRVISTVSKLLKIGCLISPCPLTLALKVVPPLKLRRHAHSAAQRGNLD
jgi:hypothetical protein